MTQPTKQYDLTAEQRTELERRVRSTKISKRDSERASIVLLRADGMKQRDVAKKLGVSHSTVSKWTMRFEEQGLEGLKDAPGRGCKPSIDISKVQKVIDQVAKPPEGSTRWSTRTMGREAGVSHMTVQRIWKSNDIKPHRTKTFKVSNDPQFEEKFWDVIGLYLDPPEKAIVLCCDEKSQCQALERTQPGLPLGIGHIKTKTHDYIRHGTVTLFTALNQLEGSLISRIEKRHTHVEWLRFLKQIDRETPKDVDLHIVADNYSTHKNAKVKEWLSRRPRFHMHFTPTSSSWLNVIERWFRDITDQRIRRGVFKSVSQLITAIMDYVDHHNNDPRTFTWTAKAADILEKVTRAKAALDKTPIA
jgi:transposase